MPLQTVRLPAGAVELHRQLVPFDSLYGANAITDLRLHATSLHSSHVILATSLHVGEYEDFSVKLATTVALNALVNLMVMVDAAKVGIEPTEEWFRPSSAVEWTGLPSEIPGLKVVPGLKEELESWLRSAVATDFVHHPVVAEHGRRIFHGMKKWQTSRAKLLENLKRQGVRAPAPPVRDFDFVPLRVREGIWSEADVKSWDDDYHHAVASLVTGMDSRGFFAKYVPRGHPVRVAVTKFMTERVGDPSSIYLHIGVPFLQFFTELSSQQTFQHSGDPPGIELKWRPPLSADELAVSGTLRKATEAFNDDAARQILGRKNFGQGLPDQNSCAAELASGSDPYEQGAHSSQVAPESASAATSMKASEHSRPKSLPEVAKSGIFAGDCYEMKKEERLKVFQNKLSAENQEMRDDAALRSFVLTRTRSCEVCKSIANSISGQPPCHQAGRPNPMAAAIGGAAAGPSIYMILNGARNLIEHIGEEGNETEMRRDFLHEWAQTYKGGKYATVAPQITARWKAVFFFSEFIRNDFWQRVTDIKEAWNQVQDGDTIKALELDQYGSTKLHRAVLTWSADDVAKLLHQNALPENLLDWRNTFNETALDLAIAEKKKALEREEQFWVGWSEGYGKELKKIVLMLEEAMRKNTTTPRLEGGGYDAHTAGGGGA